MVGIERVLKQISLDLSELNTRWALVGGLAVSIRAEPRTTRDLDFAVAVEDDRRAQQLVLDLKARGYGIETLLEQEKADRIATVRLLAPGEEPGGIIVDLLFASSGAEPEIVNAADRIEVLPGVEIPVARLAHLLAVKILAGRPKDLVDIESLRREARDSDLDACRSLLEVIDQRGYGRNKNLREEFERFLSFDE